MSDLTTLTNALLAQRGKKYFNELSAWISGMLEQMLNVQAALFVAVTATSTTSLTLGAGSKSLTLSGDDPKSFSAGQRLNVYHDANNKCVGEVDSYNAETRLLTFNVEAKDIVGSGSHTSWTVSLSGDEGPEGPPGATFVEQGALISTGGATVLVNTRRPVDKSTSFSIPLPPTAEEGDTVWFDCYGLGGLLTFDLNGLKYFGSTVNPTTSGQGSIIFTYTDTETGWISL